NSNKIMRDSRIMIKKESIISIENENMLNKINAKSWLSTKDKEIVY
ncbi:10936_t:CDS:1, partial [Scutellospora calospora]